MYIYSNNIIIIIITIIILVITMIIMRLYIVNELARPGALWSWCAKPESVSCFLYLLKPCHSLQGISRPWEFCAILQQDTVDIANMSQP